MDLDRLAARLADVLSSRAGINITVPNMQVREETDVHKVASDLAFRVFAQV